VTLPTDSPFREEDPQARVDALRAQRDELAQRVRLARGSLRRRRVRGVVGFLVGSAVFPAMIALVIAVLALSC
jgi:hypothetical protein